MAKPMQITSRSVGWHGGRAELNRISHLAESSRAWFVQPALLLLATRESQLTSCCSGKVRRRSSAYRARVLENSFKGESSYGK